MARVCWIHQYSKTGNTEVSPLRTCWKSWSIGCVIQLFLPPGESWEVYLFVCLLYVPGDIGYGDCPLKLLSLISPVTRQLEYVSSCQHSKKHKPEASLLNNMQENCSAWCMVTFPSQSEAGIWVVFFLIIFCSGEQRNYGEQLSQISLLDSMWLVSHLLRVWEPPQPVSGFFTRGICVSLLNTDSMVCSWGKEDSRASYFIIFADIHIVVF